LGTKADQVAQSKVGTVAHSSIGGNIQRHDCCETLGPNHWSPVLAG
jgi:hypothetical protein